MVDFYNMPVVHATNGAGKIIEMWDGKSIKVRFANCEKHYYFPLVFTAGKLKAANAKDEALLQEVIDRWVVFAFEREMIGAVKEEVISAFLRICAVLHGAYPELEVAKRIAPYFAEPDTELSEEEIERKAEGYCAALEEYVASVISRELQNVVELEVVNAIERIYVALYGAYTEKEIARRVAKFRANMNDGATEEEIEKTATRYCADLKQLREQRAAAAQEEPKKENE